MIFYVYVFDKEIDMNRSRRLFEVMCSNFNKTYNFCYSLYQFFLEELFKFWFILLLIGLYRWRRCGTLCPKTQRQACVSIKWLFCAKHPTLCGLKYGGQTVVTVLVGFLIYGWNGDGHELTFNLWVLQRSDIECQFIATAIPSIY